VITGSMNWSTSGGFYNDENMIVIHDPHIADQYFQEFAARFIQAGGVLSPGVTEVTIGEIQYSEDPSGNSPYTGVTVTTSGLVTAAFGNGFFLSENNGTPWSGLFVFDSAVLPAVGDSLTLTGTVTEYYELTELDNVTTATLHNSGLTPVPIAISCLEAASEQHEGCFLQLDDLIVVDPDLGFGEWSVSDGTGTLVIDDMGSYSYIPQAGDPIEQLTGPLTYSFGVFKLEPRDDGDIVLLLPGVNDLTITTDGNSVHLSWTAIPGATTYRVYAANTAFFTPLPENLVTETALQYYDEIVAGGSRFYRVVALN
nr:hypothetical protein [bacterium]